MKRERARAWELRSEEEPLPYILGTGDGIFPLDWKANCHQSHTYLEFIYFALLLKGNKSAKFA